LTVGGPFLFGKLPMHGDFVCRGMRPVQRSAWDVRCTATLADARMRLGDAYEASLEAVAPRGFLLAPTDAEPFWQTGVAAPSCDRAGRLFLLVLGMMSEGGWGEGAPAVAALLQPCLRMAIAEGADADTLIARMEDAAEAGVPDAVAMMMGWRTDWIEAAVRP